MGWTYRWDSKEALVSYLVKPYSDKTGKWEVISHQVVGNSLWTVNQMTKNPNPSKSTGLLSSRYIILYLLDCSNGQWGYKDIDESMGPNDTSCPVSYLGMVSPCFAGKSSFSMNWRERVLSACGYQPGCAVPPTLDTAEISRV